MRAAVLLNMDLGELAHEPEELYGIAHLAHIACGGHAGDDASMHRAVELCRARGVQVGAHPSYPDHEGFGRRPMQMTSKALRATVAEQCGRLASVARAHEAMVAFVKPHGALYHAADRDAELAGALVGGAIDALGSRITVVGPAGGELAAFAARACLPYAREGFADRAARADGTPLSRDDAGAVLLDPAHAAARARALVARGEVETVCVHGDTPRAASIARAVRAAIDAVPSA